VKRELSCWLLTIACLDSKKNLSEDNIQRSIRTERKVKLT